MNVEHRTLNVQHRIMYSVNFKKTEQAYSAKEAMKAKSESTFRNLSAFGGFCGSLVLKSIKRSVINIQCSMLDVRCSTFNAYSPPVEDSLFRPGGVSYERFKVLYSELTVQPATGASRQAWSSLHVEPLNAEPP